MYAAARHACLRRIERVGRETPVDEPPEASEPGLPEAEREVLTRDLQDEVRAANALLPDRQREVLVLREVEQLSYAEIGELMSLHPNAVAQLAWRARVNLRSAMRRGALLSIAPASEDCERALMLLALEEDGALDDGDAGWLGEHLDDCARCGANRAAMAEAGATYRSWTPAAVPVAFGLLLEEAKAAVGERTSSGGHGPGTTNGGDERDGSSLGTRIAGGMLLVIAIALAIFPAALGSPGDPPKPAAAVTEEPVTVEEAATDAPKAKTKARRRASTTDAPDADDDPGSPLAIPASIVGAPERTTDAPRPRRERRRVRRASTEPELADDDAPQSVPAPVAPIQPAAEQPVPTVTQETPPPPTETTPPPPPPPDEPEEPTKPPDRPPPCSSANCPPPRPPTGGGGGLTGGGGG
jgi:hypothetical protein